MSQENVEIVRDQIDAFNAFMRGELTREAGAELLDPQIEVHWQDERTMAEFPRDIRGAEDLIAYLEERRSGLQGLEPLGFIEAPDGRVVTPIRQRFRASEGGVPLETHFFYVWTIRDGRPHHVEIYLRRADALQAAGLRAQAISEENVEVVRRCYGFWTDRDSSTFPELAHPDVIIDLSRDIFIPGVHRGLERAAQ